MDDNKIRKLINLHLPRQSWGYEIVEKPRNENTVAHVIIRYTEPELELVAIVVTTSRANLSSLPLMQWIDGNFTLMFPLDEDDEAIWKKRIKKYIPKG